MNKTITFILKRIFKFAATMFIIATGIFALLRLAPGDPRGLLMTVDMTEETKQYMAELYGLDEPLWVQYQKFILNSFQGEFGNSLFFQRPVMEVLFPALQNTLIITVPAMTLVFISAYWLGSYLGWNKGSYPDKIGSNLLIIMKSLPHFIFGLLLLVIFFYWLRIAPSGGMASTLASEQTLLKRLTTVSFYEHAWLFFLSIYLYYLVTPFLLMRNNILKESRADYIKFLRLKGFKEGVVRKHAANNSLLPLLTFTSSLISAMFGGVILLEYVFSWPGVGNLLVIAATKQDYTLAQGAFIFIAALVIGANNIIDILYAYADPRIEFGR